MGQIRLVPIFKQVVDGSGEVRRPSIVAYKAIVWSRNAQNYPVEIKQNLYVNLWLIEFELEWFRKV